MSLFQPHQNLVALIVTSPSLPAARKSKWRETEVKEGTRSDGQVRSGAEKVLPASGLGCMSVKGTSRPTSLQHTHTDSGWTGWVQRSWCFHRAWTHLDPIILPAGGRQTWDQITAETPQRKETQRAAEAPILHLTLIWKTKTVDLSWTELHVCWKTDNKTSMKRKRRNAAMKAVQILLLSQFSS